MTQRLEKAPTILDVAAAAGVSKSTVSNVVRGAAEVSAATRSRVVDAIERLGYKPNALARHFVTQRTNILGVLVGDLSNPYYAEMAEVVEREAFRCGYTTMFCNIEGAHEIAARRVDVLLAHRVAGVVLLAYLTRTPELDQVLRRERIPIVLLGLSEGWGDSVAPKDRPGGRMATEHLLDLGHRRIAYVRTPLVDPTGDRARHAGYTAAMRRATAEPLPVYVWDPGSPEAIQVGRRSIPLAEALSGPLFPTAAFVSSDIGAIAFIEACETLGRRVPADISVVGFDDIKIAGLKRISLTTVAQSLESQAERAVELLLERIEHPGRPPQHVSVDVALRERGSTAPPAGARSSRRSPP
jgi:DNA-binding LacI/PurR family transcriptional regulator